MSSRLFVLLLIAVLFGGIAWSLVTAPEPPGATVPSDTVSSPAVAVPAEWASGNSRFSQGACTRDSECVISGCSGEVCGSEAAITTCEYSESFPNAQHYQCSCIQNVCGWHAK